MQAACRRHHLQGLCAYLETIFGAEGLKRGVAIGYDHRARADLDIASENFALLTASVFLSRGFKVFLYPTMVATPLVVRVSVSSLRRARQRCSVLH